MFVDLVADGVGRVLEAGAFVAERFEVGQVHDMKCKPLDAPHFQL